MARLFVAATPPAEVIEAIGVAVALARPTAPALRWVDLARSHLTLAFLGSVEDALRAELTERLGRVARRHPPVDAVLAGVGRFGDRVLWAGVDGDLAPLAAGIRRAAQRSGVADLDPRPLRAHLTLAYARPSTEPVDLRAVMAALGELPPLAWTVDRFDLVSSVLGPQPVYAVESSWSLTGS
ncbi:RNA 2',3'-cyclic phosphodiesterase [Pseudofrankia inefficax]|uniref:RNA 2',3'-cyclic phosphodiesterase n=1 Tax=Pseudofrankia inefficax (strain DSM 45817 / CECT 9037 / DDB 130130 / EuI1c) TaxID=298654 RepID=E3IYI4_PSEI1|nr:RNA 2',3'-cyclic phosphodiesterase [Pseudofrankia inefficax]ADP85055.1 2'-5' RNA ligase [Pseudofrankia inefficax]